MECALPAEAKHLVWEKDDKKFIDYFEKKVRHTIRQYKLFTKKERIAVAVSGGKDSTSLLYVLHKLGYNVEGITVDAKIGCYTDQNLLNIKAVCDKYKIKLHVISFIEEFNMSLCFIRDVLNSKGIKRSSCNICGVLKRYLLNKRSRELGFDVLATGHNMDDEAQAFLMNVFRNDINLAMRQGPVSGVSRSKLFVKRVKPLYLMSEKETIRYSKLMGFPVNYGICPCSVDAYRRRHINLLDKVEESNPHVKYNIVRFHEQLSGMMKSQAKGDVNICKSCGEPASKDTCMACEILEEIKRKPHPQKRSN
jgi:tRNA-5-methyluridine54 2-sulfurtransferase